MDSGSIKNCFCVKLTVWSSILIIVTTGYPIFFIQVFIISVKLQFDNLPAAFAVLKFLNELIYIFLQETKNTWSKVYHKILPLCSISTNYLKDMSEKDGFKASVAVYSKYLAKESLRKFYCLEEESFKRLAEAKTRCNDDILIQTKMMNLQRQFI